MKIADDRFVLTCLGGLAGVFLSVILGFLLGLENNLAYSVLAPFGLSFAGSMLAQHFYRSK
jgi:hypothetical protein